MAIIGPVPRLPCLSTHLLLSELQLTVRYILLSSPGSRVLSGRGDVCFATD